MTPDTNIFKMFTDSRYVDAYLYATRAHTGQVRKYTGDPYVVHPATVAALMFHIGLSPDAVIAAFLHDVVEDCGRTYDDLLTHGFSEKTVKYVYELTDPPNDWKGYEVAPLNWTVEDGPYKNNRKGRKAHCRLRLSLAPAEAQSIKVGDLIDNTKSIVEFDKDFARLYMHEKDLLLNDLTKADPGLLATARAQVASGWNYLKGVGGFETPLRDNSIRADYIHDGV